MFQKRTSGVPPEGTDGRAVDGEDPFAWLEEIEGDGPLRWVRAENKRTQHTLEGDARFKTLYGEAFSILNATDRIAMPSLFRNTVRNFWQDTHNVRGVWRQMPLDDYLGGSDQWRTIIDFDALAEKEGENWVFGGVCALAPEHDLVMVKVSRGGSDAAVTREFSISQGAFVENGFDVPEAKGSTAWRDADALFVASADGPNSTTQSGYPRTVRLLLRGQDLSQARTIFEGQATDIGISPATIVRDGKTYTFITRAVTFFESEHFLLDDAGEPQKLPLPMKSEIQTVFNQQVIVSLQSDWKSGDALYPSGSIIAFNIQTGKVSTLFVPSNRQSVGRIFAGRSALYIELLDNVVGTVKRFVPKKNAWQEENIELPGAGTMSVVSINAYGDDAFFTFDSPVESSTLFYVDRQKKPHQLKKSPEFFDTTKMTVEQYTARSRDGTDIPYFVIGRKDVITKGGAPVIQYGYGGFEVPITPGYSGVLGKLWLEAGGLYVIANIRGGGEFGPRWHQMARRENRQCAFEDFFAVSGDLIASGVTTADRLGAYGASNGGLLMGVALTQRPDLYRALAIGVPLLDMLRFHKLLAGASWIDEYGDPEIETDREVLARYSPYHNIKADRRYPEPFIFTSTKDDRVHPGHARKMAAKMRELGNDLFYYENIEGGHGAAANRQQEAYRAALQYVYFRRKLIDQK